MKRSGTRKRSDKPRLAPVMTARWDGSLFHEQDPAEGLTSEQIKKIITRLGGLEKAIKFSEGD